MLLQRLIVDPACGLNYDYMGYAEFEHGATRIARIQLAKLQIENNIGAKKVRLFEKFGMSTSAPIEVFIFGSKRFISTLGTSARPPRIGDLTIPVDKTSMRHDNEKIVGWMAVRTDEPLLILRATQDNIKLADQFIQIFMDGILAEEDQFCKQELYTFTSGHVLRRVTGPVILPQNDGVAIEGGGQWVLFDKDNNAIDRDKYFSDITEKWQRTIGEPLQTDD